jgi:hypothetical protein
VISRPTTPHADELIGINWPEIDEVALAQLAANVAAAATGATTAENKTYADAATYYQLLPEGFEAQVQAAYRVGSMAQDLAGWFTKGAGMIGASAAEIALTKTAIGTTVAAAEALIAAKKIEIAALLSAPLIPAIRDPRIQQLLAEIRATINLAKQDIAILYNGIDTPSLPIPLAFQPLTYKLAPAPAAPAPYRPAPGKPVLRPAVVTPELSVPAAPGDGIVSGVVKPVGNLEPATAATLPDSPGLPASTATPQTPVTQPSAPGAVSAPAPAGSSGVGGSMPSAPPASSGGASPGSGSAVPAAPGSAAGSGGGAPASSGAAPSSPSGVAGSPAGSGAGGSGASPAPGGRPGVSPVGSAAPAPGQQSVAAPAAPSLAGAGSAAGTASSAASAAAFRPPLESTVSSSPVQGTPATASPGVGQSVPATAGPAGPGGVSSGVATPSVATTGVAAAAAAGPVAAPLAPPPPAGVPNPAPPVLPGSPAAVGTPGGSVGTPVAPPPNVITSFGGQQMAAKLAQMGSTTVGAGLAATPEFTAATALTAALNDPAFGVGEWACAVFQTVGEKPRFVIAGREGLSWIPAGLFMPDGVVLAHLDPRIDWSVRKLWRGLRPPARVLSSYARIIGEEPQVVVARHYLGLDGLFSPHTVVVADDKTIIDPNPLHNPVGRHRLALASPDGWWPQVQTIPEADIAARISGVASWVADTHDQAFGIDPLRAAAVAQIGRAGGDHVWHEVEQRMHVVRAEIMTAPIDAPEPLTDGWNDGLVAAEQLLRGWETLWLGKRVPGRETLADMTYAAVAATM